MKIKIISLFFLALFFISPVWAADPACSFCEFINISKGDPGPEGPTGPMNMTMNLTINQTANMTAGPKGDTGSTGPTGPTGPMNQTFNLTANMTSGPANMTMNLTANMTMNLTSVDTTNFLFQNGSRMMTGIFNGGKYNISNITTFLSTDAVNKSYVDAVNSSMKAYVDALPSGGDTSPFLFLNGSRWMTGNLNMSKFNVSNITTIAGGDAINLTLVGNMNSSLMNNVSQYVIAVNNTQNTQETNYNDTMRNNVSQYVIAVNNTNIRPILIPVQAINQSPTINTLSYFGNSPKAPTISTIGSNRIYIRKAGTIKGAEIMANCTTSGTINGWSLYIVKNSGTDNTTLIQNKTSGAAQQYWTNTTISLAVASGDYIEIKDVMAPWTTAPTSITFGGYIYYEQS